MKRLKSILAAVLFVTLIISGRPLKAQLAKNKCKFLGNVIANTTPANFKSYWNQVTPENAGKWASVEATRDVMNWTALDNAYQYAKENHVPFKQHTLVWGQQQPGWLSTLTAAEQKQEVEEWIKSFSERYPETDYIDVVNEPLHAAPFYAEALGGNGSTGWDWVIWAFEKARQYCPNAKLVLNDYSIISSDANTNQYLTIIGLLKERDLVDVIGEQGHFLETTPVATIQNNLDKLYAAALPIHISEFDVNLADDNAQFEKYKELFPVLWTHAGVHGITLWGYEQGHIWREAAYLVRANGSERPALAWLSSYVKDSKGGTFCDPVTGMLDEQDAGLEMYPSPAPSGNFTLASGGGRFAVRILDSRGQVKKQLNITDSHPVVVQLQEAAGLYFLEVFDGRQTTCKKFLVN